MRTGLAGSTALLALPVLHSHVWLLPGAATADVPEACWIGGYSRELCCDQSYGPRGNTACWDDLFQYEKCCVHSAGEATVAPNLAVVDEATVAHAEYLERALGPKLDLVLSDGNGTSPDALEASLRAAVRLPEERQMSERMSRAFLAVLLWRQGRTLEAASELQRFAESDFAIAASGAWLGVSAAGYHMHDRPFAEALVSFFHAQGARTVGDFGCGLGLYVRDLRQAGFRAGGLDGNPATAELSEGRCLEADLSKDVDLGTRWDWLLSLEVAEHIPREFENAFIDNLDRHVCAGLVLSWGNQAGEGHVNLRTRSEVEHLLASRGYRIVEESVVILREAATLQWLKETVLVFRLDPPRGAHEGCAPMSVASGVPA